MLCKNQQIKEFQTNASRKFNLDDDTYVIKNDCCFLKEVDGLIKQVSYYVEGNPNPFNLKNLFNNEGLTTEELGNYLNADLFKIINECQNNDRRKYILPLVCIVFALCVMETILQFIMWL